MLSIQHSPHTVRFNPPSTAIFKAILLGGALVGVFDATDGVVYFGLTAGSNPIQVLQYIASGALGPAAFSGGLPAAALGALIHFGLSFGFTALLVLGWIRFAAVREHWIVAGIGWGIAVWTLMNLIVLPFSHVPPSPITILSAIHGLLGHVLTVGLTPAYAALRTLRPAGGQP